MKFKDYLCEPQVFSDNSIVMMAHNNTAESFFEAVNKAIENDELYPFEDIFTDKETFIREVKEDWVHCHINGADDEFDKTPAWWLWSKHIKGSQRVFIY